MKINNIIMKKILSTAVMAMVILSTSSCATIFTGTKDPISFNSKPEGAKVVFKGVEKCVTPCTIEVSRSLGKQMITIKKEGFANEEFKLEKKFNAVTLLNLLVGGIIGFGVDLATGSFTKYDQNAYTTELKPAQ